MTVKARFLKYPRMQHLAEALDILDNNVNVFEKMDGGNSQVRKIKGRIICGSRARFLLRERDLAQPWFKNFQRWALSNYSFYNLPENLVVYGEWLSRHTIDYNPEFIDKFFLIDLYNINKKMFLHYDEAKQTVEDLEIEDVLTLNELARGMVTKNQLEKLALGKSDYSDGSREGVVIKDYENQRFVKLWRSTIELPYTSVIEEIDRIVNSLQDQRKSFSRSDLYRIVYWELRRSDKTIPFQHIRELIDKYIISKRIKSVSDSEVSNIKQVQ